MPEKILTTLLLIIISGCFFVLNLFVVSNLKEQSYTMTHQKFPLDSMSAELEKVAIKRFRDLTLILPEKCAIYRRIEDRVMVLYLDFLACPQELSTIMKHYGTLTVASHKLGLADSLVFSISNHIVGWTNLTKNN